MTTPTLAKSNRPKRFVACWMGPEGADIKSITRAACKAGTGKYGWKLKTKGGGVRCFNVGDDVPEMNLFSSICVAHGA
ncbi:hypothetical protein H4219_006469, partial [Mycoemilia scoparia]